MELHRMTKTPKKNPDTQESIFSEELGRSLPLKDVLVLGQHISTELGFSGSCDTLGKWMSHHLAEIIDRAENEEKPELKKEYQSQAVELILKLWKQRSDLNNYAYPLSRFKDILDALSILSPEANVWERNKLGEYEDAAASSFHLMTELYRSLHFVEFVGLKRAKEKQVPPSTLTEEEQRMYELLVSWAEKELAFRSQTEGAENVDDMKHAQVCVTQLIDNICESLQELKSVLSPN